MQGITLKRSIVVLHSSWTSLKITFKIICLFLTHRVFFSLFSGHGFLHFTTLTDTALKEHLLPSLTALIIFTVLEFALHLLTTFIVRLLHGLRHLIRLNLKDTFTHLSFLSSVYSKNLARCPFLHCFPNVILIFLLMVP